jgi:hypothetical protein
VNDREDTLATNPLAITVLDSSIVQDSSLVKLHPSHVDVFGKGNFIGMKIIEAGSSNDLGRVVPQDLSN